MAAIPRDKLTVIFLKNCEYMNDSKRSCRILKHLYCKLEPDKKCSWYKQKGSCKNGEIKVAEKDI